MIDALEFLADIEHDEYLGILEPINMDDRLPIVLPHMNRTHLARLFAALGYKVGAEIGVWRGDFSLALWKANKKATIYSIDPWAMYDEYPEKNAPEVMDEAFRLAQRRLTKTSCIIIRAFSMDAVKTFRDGELDFVYIDGNHTFEYVTNDIAEWSKKVRIGGIVSGHDYARYKNKGRSCHVKSVVAAWAYSHSIRPWFVNKGGKYPGWFWVKDAN